MKKIFSNKKTIVLVSLGALAPLLIFITSIIYVPINPFGFWISGTLIDFTNRSLQNLSLGILMNAILGAFFFYLLAMIGNKYGWLKTISIYLIGVAIISSSNFINLGFRYFWNRAEYATYYCSLDPNCPGIASAETDSYLGLWIKPLKTSFVVLKRGAGDKPF